MLDLDTIQAFLEVAKVGSISHASKKIRVTQPAISQRIKILEHYLGESLFNRKRSGMELNNRGQEFFALCADIKKNLDFIEDWRKNKQGKIEGHIHITTISSFISYVFPKFLKNFLKKYPKVNVTIDVRTSAFVEEKVLKSDSDLGVIVGLCKRESLKIQKLCDNNVLMVCAPSYFLAKKKRITKQDLEKARVLMHADTHSRTVKIISKELGFSSEKDFGDIYLIDMEACKAHAVEGIGVAFVAKIYIGKELRDKKLVALPGFSLDRPIYLISRNEKYESQLIQVFKKEFVEYCRKLKF